MDSQLPAAQSADDEPADVTPNAGDATEATRARPAAAEPAPSPSAILDGSQALAHDGHDVDLFARAAGDYGRLGRLVDEAGARLRTAPALLRDLYWSFVKRAPRLAPPAPLTPAHELNRAILQELMTTTAWRDARAAGTVGDALTSAMATIGTAGQVLAALDPDTIDHVNELARLEGAAEELLAQAETLDDLATQGVGERVADLLARAVAARQQATEAVTRAATLIEQVAAGAEARADAVRRAARAGLAEAAAEIEQATAAIKAFGGGYGVGAGSGGMGGPPLSLKDKLALAQQVGQSPTLQQIAALAGRLVRIALQVQATRVVHPPDEVTTVTTGADLARVLPSELALLPDPATEDLFFVRFTEQRLLQYELVGQDPQGQGPIVLAVDGSGSMAGPKEVWAKAVALALLAIAGKQRRELAVLHFGGTPQELRVFRFPRGQATPQDLLACASLFYGGGTRFEPWMQAALDLIDEAAFERADVVCLSDGLVGIDPAVHAAWQRRRRERGMRCFAVLIGTHEGAGVLATISDALLSLDRLQDDLPVLSTIFAI
ncbi:MAG: hypothetical protein IT340_18095 [Chloroflexi bacterium]|nr:hypothetical protein [Chloroflexota bacterium]